MVQDNFKALLDSTLSSIAESKVYTDIKDIYKSGDMDRKLWDEVVTRFHGVALPHAMSTAQALLFDGQKLEKELELLNQQIKLTTIQTEIAGIQKAKEDAKITKSLSLLDKQIAGEQTKNEIATIQKAKEDAKITKSLSLLDKQIDVEGQRKELLLAQTKGFYDNRIIHLAQENRSLAGEIQSGGNDTPQAVWDLLFSSYAALAKVANEHPDLDGTQITVGNAPTTPA